MLAQRGNADTIHGVLVMPLRMELSDALAGCCWWCQLASLWEKKPAFSLVVPRFLVEKPGCESAGGKILYGTLLRKPTGWG
ncbi:MAG TPA: hypothetical protein IGS52_06595 [Oscillatoriaceae cyanobacterium M33_DOE_052]|uniref:Uncharacterized protein n=1 Tax=Planktothricoides sp. SpSt-374 TaxID=2282167 RepID=A0A7C3VGW3_9CYAN|nr:hypothetical protein [Oscillatoriaceae cyanobacterium M33_DOE_052]